MASVKGSEKAEKVKSTDINVVFDTSGEAPMFRYRAGSSALFSSTKCPAGPGVVNSCQLPFGFLWTPLSPLDDSCGVHGISDGSGLTIDCGGEALPPVLCLTCLAYLNLYATVSLETGIWTCPFCGAKNVTAADSLKEGQGAFASLLVHPTVEFQQHLAFRKDEQFDTCSVILVMDQNLPSAEAQAVGATMQTILSDLAADVTSRIKVGLVVFGKNVSIYQLGIKGMASADVFFHPNALTEELLVSRSYTATLQKGDNLEFLWICLSAVYGIDLQDENLKQKKPSRLEILRQRKEARLCRQREGTESEGDRVFSNVPVAKSPWTEAKLKDEASQAKRCTGEAVQCAIDLATVAAEDSSRTSRILLFTNGCPNYGDSSVVVMNGANEMNNGNAKPCPDIVDPAMMAQTVQYFDTIAKAASELGVAMDVFCTGSSELALPSYQALVQPSAGYVLSHTSFLSEHLKCNVEYVLKHTYVPGLHFEVPRTSGNSMPLRDEHWLEGCIVDVRMSSFLAPTHFVGPGEIVKDEIHLLANERSAFAVGASLSASHGLPTNNLPVDDILSSTLTRIRMGRADPMSTFSLLIQVNEFFQRESFAMFQCVVRYLDRNGQSLNTRVFTHRMAVAKQRGEWLDAVDDEVVPVLLAKEAVYRSLLGREIKDEDDVDIPDFYKLEDLAYDAQRDLDSTIHRVSSAFRLLGLELGTTRNGMDLTEEGGVKAAGSSVDFAFPPELADSLRRLYHFRRGPLLSPGPMQSMDDRAEFRSLFLRLPLEDCLNMMALSLWTTGPLISPPDVNMPPLSILPPETLALWDNSILVGDLQYEMFLWSGRLTLDHQYDSVREKLKNFLLERSEGRFPKPTLHILTEDDSMSRRFTALLAPTHGDPVEHQLANFPLLSKLSSQELAALQSKFNFHDPSTDASFRIWFWDVVSATNGCKDEGFSLCE